MSTKKPSLLHLRTFNLYKNNSDIILFKMNEVEQVRASYYGYKNFTYDARVLSVVPVDGDPYLRLSLNLFNRRESHFYSGALFRNSRHKHFTGMPDYYGFIESHDDHGAPLMLRMTATRETATFSGLYLKVKISDLIDQSKVKQMLEEINYYQMDFMPFA
jgi:hypothetical protein